MKFPKRLFVKIVPDYSSHHSYGELDEIFKGEKSPDGFIWRGSTDDEIAEYILVRKGKVVTHPKPPNEISWGRDE